MSLRYEDPSDRGLACDIKLIFWGKSAECGSGCSCEPFRSDRSAAVDKRIRCKSGGKLPDAPCFTMDPEVGVFVFWGARHPKT